MICKYSLTKPPVDYVKLAKEAAAYRGQHAKTVAAICRKENVGESKVLRELTWELHSGGVATLAFIPFRVTQTDGRVDFPLLDILEKAKKRLALAEDKSFAVIDIGTYA